MSDKDKINKPVVSTTDKKKYNFARKGRNQRSNMPHSTINNEKDYRFASIVE